MNAASYEVRADSAKQHLQAGALNWQRNCSGQPTASAQQDEVAAALKSYGKSARDAAGLKMN
jgi:hypothetical protein